jgi:hexosaminidase
VTVMPRPVRCAPTGGEPFRLAATTRIVAGHESLRGPAELLADRLRTATGFPLPVVGGPGDIRLLPGDPGTGATTGFARHEAYRLSAGADAVTIVGSSPAGVFRGTHTLLQLLFWQNLKDC